MDKLWSPWRSKYIESFKHKTKDEDCIFCEVLKKNNSNEDSLLIHRGKYSFILLNLYPYNSGHLMVVPNRHIADFRELNGDELSEIMMFVQKSISALEYTIKPQGYNIGVNIGKAAGAGLDAHMHFHLVPRWTGDINFMPAIGEVKIISQDLLETKKNLTEAFKKILDK